MSPLDEQLLQRKIKLIEDDFVLLTPYKTMQKSAYAMDEKAQLVVERLMERIIGRLIDINYHVLKEQFGITPTNYYDSFLALAHEHVVDETLAASVAKSTGLRNILAHDYDEIDNGKVYDTIHVALSEVPQYLKAILTYL